MYTLSKNIYLILSLAMLVVFFNSCRSEDADQNQNKKFFLKAKFNGETKIFESLYSVGKGYNNVNLSSLSLIYEVSKTGNTPYPQVKVFLQSKNPNSGVLESGTYPEDNFFNEFEYKTSTSESKASKSALNDFVYIITEVNSKIIKGTFSGTIENDTGEIIVVSDGEFYGFEK